MLCSMLDSTNPIAVTKLSDEVEEKAISRLGITYGVLRRLGFSENKVYECLQAINGVSLDEAFEWVSCFL
jgi:ATP-dependent RNA helicase DHX29